jgi:hypothetical protein
MTYGTTPSQPVPPQQGIGVQAPVGDEDYPEDTTSGSRSAIDLTDPNDPVAIERDIERTRESLRSGVDALQDKVMPSRVVGRRVEQVRQGARGLTERVMGSDDSDRAGVGGAVSSARDAASSARETVVGGVSDAAEATGRLPDAARRKTQGNPLAAGTIAFGVGWLVASLIPPARKERELGEKLADKVDTQGIASSVQDKVQETAEKVTHKAAESVREAADKAEEKVGTTTQPS